MNQPLSQARTPCLAVVMPLYNEAATAEQVVNAVLRQPIVQELIVVDDASSDGSWTVIQSLAERDKRIKAFRHEKNSGKGAALRTGFKHATAPVVIVQDA